MSIGIYTPPAITVQFDLDSDEFVLMATSHARTQPAGERLFRAQPWPSVSWRHTSQESAEADAATLRAYLANPPKRTRKTSEEAEANASKDPLKDAVWNL